MDHLTDLDEWSLETLTTVHSVVADLDDSNVTAETVALTEGDVLRFGLQGVAANEATVDWDLNEGGEWSVQ